MKRDWVGCVIVKGSTSPVAGSSTALVEHFSFIVRKLRSGVRQGREFRVGGDIL